MKKEHYQILSIALFLLIVAGLYLYNLQQDLPGADDNASSVIGQVAPNYKPWFSGIGIKLGKMTERIMFGMQLLGGVVVFAICFRHLQKQNKISNNR